MKFTGINASNADAEEQAGGFGRGFARALTIGVALGALTACAGVEKTDSAASAVYQKYMDESAKSDLATAGRGGQSQSSPSVEAAASQVSGKTSQIAQLNRDLDRQRQALVSQQGEIERIQGQISSLQSSPAEAETAGIYALDGTNRGTGVPRVQHGSTARAGSGASQLGTPYQTVGAQVASENREFVGERPPEEEEERQRIDIVTIADVGGVLTPKGVLTIDPSLTYSHSDVNKFVFRGVQILDAFLIGRIEASQADRDFLGGSLAARYGVTNRMEVSVQVPGVYRRDSVTNTIDPSDPASVEIERSTEGYGLGDVEFGAQYQINDGKNGWPFLVANVKAKAPTGESPFDVRRDSDGIELESPTGSGFWAVQPSLTVIAPTDPLVYYGSVSYLLNLEKNVNTAIGGILIGKFDPGDAVGVSFGAALGITEDVSASFGYEHFYIFKNKQEQTALTGPTAGLLIKTESDDLQVGAISFALNQRLKQGSFNVQLGVGVTEDAPDISITLRRPLNFAL